MMLYFQIKLLSASMDLLTRSVPPEKQDWKNDRNGQIRDKLDKIEKLKQWTKLDKIKSWKKKMNKIGQN